MKILNYFLGFNAFALAAWVYSAILIFPDTSVNSYIVSCLIFSALSTTSVYNLYEGYKKHKSEF